MMKYSKRIFEAGIIILFIYILIFSNSVIISIYGNNSEEKVFLSQDKKTIVATVSIAGDFVSNLVKDQAEVVSLVSGMEDPHSYEPTSSDLLALSNADMIVAMGVPNLESWLTSYLSDNPDREAVTIYAGDLTTMGKVDPLLGYVNGHIWMDPNNAKLMVKNIAVGLVNIAGMDNATITANMNEYLQKLDQLLIEIEDARSKWNGTKVVVDHPAFFYLFELLGIKRIATIETTEGSEPSAQDIARIVNLMKEENCKLIIETYQQAKATTVDEIAKETGAKIAQLTALLGVEGANTYLDMIRFDLYQLEHPIEPEGSDSTFLNWDNYSLFIGLAILAIPVLVLRKKGEI